MKTALKNTLAAAIAVTALVAAPSIAADKKKETADSVITVYVSAHGGSEIARKLNESHVKMEAEGWRFVEHEIHTENGDTKGVLITYTK